ncbi:hypothetical protein ABNC90_08710 [Paenibacillus larvae]|uniref:ABC-2 family transporter protein n=1 Tax=Paenibacillus larvae subsp. larvae DSM 25430 TaxID=697284 RepID=V9W1U8_9BACL|nr:ABC-2 family transporter protein [Paenibacillus larvae]AHD04083.1 ABC-2 family transporter protein [Paenibacillus larvae subsp. larvae DSM 25430]AVG10692.1 ABC-2 family transporter protein [Paenibacillus larvae subsp. larvae DSM 25430]MDR5567512.1 hypothetical protein [Paenibacillus larvae]MDR5585229.1 hypothetical protein [Paenibacillus larvae]MDR5594482.1 hypothetical protein [Paenibacillus larvae]
MLRLMKFQALEFMRKPVWFVLFLGAIGVAVFLPSENLTDLYIIPSLIYMIMMMTLLFFLFGAEEARAEQMNNQIEFYRTTPKLISLLVSKLLYWLILATVVYFILYLTVVGYIQFTHHNVTIKLIGESFTYTVFCWLLPFYFSLLLGYLFYSIYPSLFSYLGIIVLWFLTTPYNSMLGFIPSWIGGWLINGDTNVQLTATNIYPLEKMLPNTGVYIQRLFMCLLLLSLFGLIKAYQKVQLKRVCGGLVIAVCTLPIFSPYVPYITDPERTGLQDSVFTLPQGNLSNKLDYKISDYHIDFVHGQNNHDFNYTVDISLTSQKPEIVLALWQSLRPEQNFKELNLFQSFYFGDIENKDARPMYEQEYGVPFMDLIYNKYAPLTRKAETY